MDLSIDTTQLDSAQLELGVDVGVLVVVFSNNVDLSFDTTQLDSTG